jgi:hypothetical protein
VVGKRTGGDFTADSFEAGGVSEGDVPAGAVELCLALSGPGPLGSAVTTHAGGGDLKVAAEKQGVW